MQFGRVDHTKQVNFSLPVDHLDTSVVLLNCTNKELPKIFVGCSQWSPSKLKGFYPPGTKDALTYYATQFNSVELNATFYRIFSPETFATWYQKTPIGFKFFPKLYQDISHWKRLNGVQEVVDDFLYSATNLKEKLGTIFLQLPANFSPKDFERVEAFIKSWPIEIPLAIEFRHADWYNDASIANRLFDLLESYNISNVIVDTAGRRDLLHMRLTNSSAFVRFVGTNLEIDYLRLDEWVERLKHWKQQGIKEINFFVHQDIEKESPLLAAYFINRINAELGMDLQIPYKEQNLKLF